jgi:hypothetical protein
MQQELSWSQGLAVGLSRQTGQKPLNNEAEESPLLEAITKQ